MRAVTVGFDVVGFDLDVERIKRLADGDVVHRGRARRRVARGARRRAGTPRPIEPDRVLRLRRRRHHRADTAARRRPRPLLHRGRGADARPATCGPGRRSCSSRPPTRAPPRSCSSRSSRRAPDCSAGATSPSATARSASTPATARGTFGNTPEDRLRHRRGLARRRRTRSTAPSSTTVVPVATTPVGRAHQAAREHVPARQHRARQRAGDVRRASSTSTSGRPSTPPPPSRSGSCASRRARASAATACRSTRATCRGRCAAAARSAVPVRRAGQRRQRPHARTTSSPGSRRAEPPGHRPRRAAVSCCSGCRTSATPATPASRRRCAVAELLVADGAEVRGRRSARRRATSFAGGVSGVELTPRRCAPADWSSCCTDHDAFDYDLVVAERARRCSTPGTGGGSECRAPLSAAGCGRSGWRSSSRAGRGLSETLRAQRVARAAPRPGCSPRCSPPSPATSPTHTRSTASSNRSSTILGRGHGRAAGAEVARGRWPDVGVDAVSRLLRPSPGRGRTLALRRDSACRTASACTPWTPARCQPASSATRAGGAAVSCLQRRRGRATRGRSAPTRSLVPHGVDLDRFRRIAPARASPVELLAVGRLVRQEGLRRARRRVDRIERRLAPAHRRRRTAAARGPRRARRRDGSATASSSSARGPTPISRRCTPPPTSSSCRRVSIADGDRDGLPNVVLEAMASGRPSCASDVAAIPTAVERPGHRAAGRAGRRLRARQRDRSSSPRMPICESHSAPAPVPRSSRGSDCPPAPSASCRSWRQAYG